MVDLIASSKRQLLKIIAITVCRPSQRANKLFPDVLIDGRFLLGPSRGTSFFIYNLVQSLDQLPNPQTTVAVLVPRHANIPRYNYTNIRHVSARWCGHIFWEQIILPLLIAYFRPRVFHAPANTGPLYRSKCTSYMATIHDVAYLMPSRIIPFPYSSPRQILGRIYRSLIVPYIISTYDQLITVSNSALDDIISYSDASACLINVIKHGKHQSYPSLTLQKSKSFLCVTGSDPQKNLKTLLCALDLLPNMTGWKLHIIGSGLPEHSYVHRNSLVVLFHGQQHPKHLAPLFQSSYALILPSLHESFGLPIVDGLLHQLYLLLSCTGSFPEIAGPASSYFDPHSPQQIASTIVQAIDAYPSNPKRLKIPEQLRLLPTWSQVAIQYSSIYTRLISHG